MTDTDLAAALLGDPSYAETTAAYSLLHRLTPARALRATTVDQVAAAVRYAAAEGLRVAAFTTGHAAGRLGALDDALLVRTAIAEPIEVDAAGRTARIPAGALVADVAAAAARHGLLAPHGSAGTVGAIGYLLNGGLGFTGRSIGVAANSIVAVEYVDAVGVLRRADADHEPDRFWALRGGGAGIGVVTAAVVRLQPGERIVTGGRFWAGDSAADLLRVWRDWALDAPDEITTSARILRLPPLPHLPGVLTSGPVVVIDGVALPGAAGDIADAHRMVRDLLDRLDAVAAPVLDTWHEGPATDALATHMDPPDPTPGWTSHELLDALPDEAIDTIVGAALGESPMLATELRQLGGAFAKPAVAGGFFDRIAEPFLLQCVAMAPVRPLVLAAHRHMAEMSEGLTEQVTGRCVPTFVESATDRRLASSAEAVARLARIRAEADPAGRFAMRV